jgi:hypothetical protein
MGALGALIRRIDAIDDLHDLRSGGVLDHARRVYQSAARGNIAPLPWTPLRPVPHGTVTEAQIADVARINGCSHEAARAIFARIVAQETLWLNETYQVNRRDLGDGGVHLSIKRIDQEPVHDWRDLQRIKNELIGPDCEAVELYPAEERRVDIANQYHLWGTSDATFRFGFGFRERLTDNQSGSHHQRSEDGL